jgi:hypothetical protein
MAMKIQVRTDKHIEAGAPLVQRAQEVAEQTLGRFGTRITRVTVHLNDENSDKAADDDKRCAMEARLAGLQPLVASHRGATVEQALLGAAKKLERLVDNVLGRLSQRRGRPSYGGSL